MKSTNVAESYRCSTQHWLYRKNTTEPTPIRYELRQDFIGQVQRFIGNTSTLASDSSVFEVCATNISASTLHESFASWQCFATSAQNFSLAFLHGSEVLHTLVDDSFCAVLRISTLITVGSVQVPGRVHFVTVNERYFQWLSSEGHFVPRSIVSSHSDSLFPLSVGWDIAYCFLCVHFLNNGIKHNSICYLDNACARAQDMLFTIC
ncbi:hypothetical protein L596_014728 [Steinernema carpocapsae]|uniref:Uncharacterized protein n=1 Tax=Steinernema carpocapsae TaxID=34508 RepID=A0A4U5NCY4_STECR|nr:hypothetical protein L596_014728 [Steinernema carpocapsae]